jgi:hypothetical protein
MMGGGVIAIFAGDIFSREKNKMENTVIQK